MLWKDEMERTVQRVSNGSKVSGSPERGKQTIKRFSKPVTEMGDSACDWTKFTRRDQKYDLIKKCSIITRNMESVPPYT